MTQVDQGKGEMMACQEIGVLEVKTDQKGTELVNPGERTFTDKTVFVDLSIEQAFASALDRFTIALVFSNVGHDLMIEAPFARFFRVKSTIRIEEGTGNDQAPVFHGFESSLKMVFEVESIIMVPRHDACGSHHVAVSIGDGQDVAGLGPFACLITHTLPTFLGYSVTTIQL